MEKAQIPAARVFGPKSPNTREPNNRLPRCESSSGSHEESWNSHQLSGVRFRCPLAIFYTLGALSGFVALIWLLIQHRQTVQHRLTLSTARALVGGLDVLVQYRPERARVGLKARISLIQPEGALLQAGVRRERGDRYGAYVVSEPENEVTGASIEVPLRRLRPDPPGVVCGVFYVTGSANAPPTSAKVRLEIWTDAGPTRLARRDATLNVINW